MSRSDHVIGADHSKSSSDVGRSTDTVLCRVEVRVGELRMERDNTSTLHMCSPPPEEPPNWESEPDQTQWTTKAFSMEGRRSEAGGGEFGAIAKLSKSLD
ncbi:hypothetical protein NQZ68_025214 [Dissostichus eleginoides]|nr:hypothetical protein NQZ68_025214 [Dissostichus eleginoides]